MWDYLRLILKNAARNRRRTLLTLLSVAASVFLLVSLKTLLAEMEGSSVLTDESAFRLLTRNAASLNVPLPLSHGPRIAAIPGVKLLMPHQAVPGYYQDPGNPIMISADDPKNFLGIASEYHTSAAEFEAYQKDRMGALVPPKMMERFGWHVGDRITIIGSLFPFDVELVVRGELRGPWQNLLFMHFDYFTELRRAHMPRSKDRVMSFWIKVHSAEDVPRVAAAIDEIFRNSEAPTRTESEKSVVLSFTSMVGNVKVFLMLISIAVIFAMLLVTMNTMAMSVRERSAEIAVLKTLGFRRAAVIALLVGESTLIALGGGVLGVLGVEIVFRSIDIYRLSKGFVQYFNITPATMLLALGLAAAVGILSAAWPAWRAVNSSISAALRHVG